VDELYTNALQGLIASGPLAVVLAIAVVVLWRRYQESLTRIEELHEKILKVFRGLNGEGGSRDGEG
jgi:hypothetical protein